jgi:CBS domain-containing protein
MLARKKLNTDIRPLTGRDSIEKAIKLMEELDSTSHPVIDSTTKKLIGQISMRTLRDLADEKLHVSDITLEEPVKIYEGQHVFEAARLMLLYEMRFIPVVDKDWVYQGTVRKQKVLEALTGMLNLAEYGSVVTIELQQRDFSLSEIIRLIEEEGAKILGVTVEIPDTENDRYEVSIKLNLQDISRVAAALRRYGYLISTESGNEIFDIDLENRADELMKYLDM